MKEKREREGRQQLHISLSSNLGPVRAAKETAKAEQVVSEGKRKKRRKSSQRALCVVLLESVFCLTLAKVF